MCDIHKQIMLLIHECVVYPVCIVNMHLNGRGLHSSVHVLCTKDRQDMCRQIQFLEGTVLLNGSIFGALGGTRRVSVRYHMIHCCHISKNSSAKS